MRQRLSSLFAGKEEQEAADAKSTVIAPGSSPIGTCERGGRAVLSGVLKSVTLRPRAGVPALEASLYDGTGHITLVWLGRRRIAGVEPGRRIVVRGRVTCDEDQPMMFNPRYELQPRDAA